MLRAGHIEKFIIKNFISGMSGICKMNQIYAFIEEVIHILCEMQTVSMRNSLFVCLFSIPTDIIQCNIYRCRICYYNSAVGWRAFSFLLVFLGYISSLKHHVFHYMNRLRLSSYRGDLICLSLWAFVLVFMH